jgi:hypothetical protein
MSCPAFVAQVPRRAEDSSFIGADSWVRMSQRTFRPAFEGPTEQSDHLGASLPHNLHFLGRIIVSYSAGRSVTVSKWGGGGGLMIKAPKKKLIKAPILQEDR